MAELNELPLYTLRRMSIEQELTLAAAPSRVWQALTTEIGQWWGAPYVCCDDSQRIELDLRCGGSLVEHGADGTQVLWGRVTSFTPNSLLVLEGPCGLQWPASGEWTYRLAAQGPDATRLKFSHSAIGDFGPEREQNYAYGWNELLDQRLRAWVEAGEARGVSAQSRSS